MNIGNAIANYANSIIGKTTNVYSQEKLSYSNKTNNKDKQSKGLDTVEISSDGYDMQENLSASSGKDMLGITKGTNPNSFIIHFDNIALAHRAVDRGYITVNGKNIQLSDEVKDKILKTSQEAFEASERATMQYAMQHNAIVARQQAEAWSDEAKRMSKAMEVMSKIASGGKVSDADRKFLAQYKPELYAMAISSEMMAKRKENHDEQQISKVREESKEENSSEDYEKELGELKHEYTETTLEVSFDNDTITVGEVGTNTYDY